MTMYTKQQIKLAVKQALEYFEYDVQPSMSAIEDEIWRRLRRVK